MAMHDSLFEEVHGQLLNKPRLCFIMYMTENLYKTVIPHGQNACMKLDCGNGDLHRWTFFEWLWTLALFCFCFSFCLYCYHLQAQTTVFTAHYNPPYERLGADNVSYLWYPFFIFCTFSVPSVILIFITGIVTWHLDFHCSFFPGKELQTGISIQGKCKFGLIHAFSSSVTNLWALLKLGVGRVLKIISQLVRCLYLLTSRLVEE
jgi:hypothetical protein